MPTTPETLRANISASAAQEDVRILREALDDFVNGGAGGPGLARALRDLQSNRQVFETAINRLETAGSAADIAGSVANLVSAVSTSLEIVSLLAGPLGPAFKTAVGLIGDSLFIIEESANTLEGQLDRISEFVVKVSPVLEDLIMLFEDGLEPTIESYMAEVERLAPTVEVLHDALAVIGSEVGIIGAAPGEERSEIPIRLIQALADVQAYARQQTIVVNEENAVENLPTEFRVEVGPDGEEVRVAGFLDALNGPESALVATLGKIDGALDALDRVDTFFGPLEQPLFIAAEVLRPIQFLLDIGGFVFEFTVEPVIKGLISAFNIDAIFNPIVEVILDLIPDVTGVEALPGQIETLVNETVFEALAGIDGTLADDLGLNPNLFDQGSTLGSQQASSQLAALTARDLGGAIQERLIEFFSESTLPRDVVDAVLGAVNSVDLSTLEDLTLGDVTIPLSDGRIMLADPNDADVTDRITLDAEDTVDTNGDTVFHDDTLVDNNGSNLLLGRGGSDVFIVAGGDDTIDGGTSTDETGEEHEDFAIFSDSIINFRFTVEDDDSVILRHFTPGSTAAYVGKNQITNIEQIKFIDVQTPADELENIQEVGPGQSFEGSDANDIVRVGPDGPADSIETFGGADFIIAGGTRSVDAGAGDDFVVIDGTEELVAGGVGADVLSLASAPVGLNIQIDNEVSLTYFDENDQEQVYVGADGDGEPIAVTGATPARTISGFEYVLGSAGNDTIEGGDADNAFDGNLGDDSLVGGGGSDTLNGSDGDDVIRGGSGRDVMIGGTGNDTFIGLDLGDDIDGGAGRDVVQVDNRTRDESFDIDLVDVPEDEDEIRITNIEELSLGNGDDEVRVGDGLERLRTGAGNDDVIVVSGTDGLVLTTASGTDDVFASVAANVDINTSSGNDRVSLFGRVDDFEDASFVIDGGAGGGDAVVLQQNTGDFRDQGGAILRGDDEGIMRGELEDNQGGTAALEISNVERFEFQGGDIDFVSGAAAVNVVTSRNGDDRIDLSDSTTTQDILVRTRDGDDVLITKSSVDSTLIGGTGNDELRVVNVGGAIASHTLDGGEGDDLLALSRGRATVEGGEGNDTLDLSDVAVGVTVVMADGEGFISSGTKFVDFGGIEAIIGTRFDDRLEGGTGADLLLGRRGDDTLVGNNGDDTMEGGAGDDLLSGRNGDDLLFGEEGNDDVRGGNGIDQLHAGVGADTVRGGDGDDLLFVTVESRLNGTVDLIFGESGIDTLSFEATAQSLGGVRVDMTERLAEHLDSGTLMSAFSGIENVLGTDLDDAIFGDAQNNLIVGNGGNDTLTGGAGNDTLQGGSGFDRIDGQDGDDTLLIGEGVTRVLGGDGQDTAVVQLVSLVALVLDENGTPRVENGELLTQDVSSDVKIVQEGATLLVQHFVIDPNGGAATVLGLARLDASVETIELVEAPVSEDAEPVIRTIDVAEALASGAFDTGEQLDGPPAEAVPDIPKLGLDARDGAIFESVELADGSVASLTLEDGNSSLVLFDPFGNAIEIESSVLADGVTTNDQDIAALEDGGFVIARGPVFEVFDENGVSVSGEQSLINVSFRPNIGNNSQPEIVPLDTGGFAIYFFNDGDVRGQSFDARGNFIDDLSSPSFGRSGTNTNVSSAQVGDNVVSVWESDDNDLDVEFVINTDLGTGGRVRGVQSINGSGGSNDINPQVIALDEETFVVIWNDLRRDEINQRVFNTEGKAITGTTTLVDDVVTTDLTAVDRGEGVVQLSYIEEDGSVTNFEYRVDEPFVEREGNERDGNAFGDEILGDNSSEDIFGFNGHDTIQADDGNDTVFGGEGNDTINAGGGDDRVFTGSGDDSVNGAFGDDNISASHGDNVLSGGSGDDRVFGGTGNDRVFGNNDDDLVRGGDGDDLVDGGAGNDSLFGDLGNDTVVGGDGNDRVEGVAGNNLLSGGSGFDSVLGGAGDDTIDGGTANDFVSGRDGDDLVDGGDGNDNMFGGNGKDTVRGGDGDDRISAGSGDDRAEGGTGADTIFGSDGEDTIFAGSGTDSVEGGRGDDTINAGGGNDIVFGGEGNDSVNGAFGDDRIEGEEGDDVLSGGSGNDTVDGGIGNDVLDGFNGNDLVRGRDGNDLVQGGEGQDTVRGDEGRDTLIGGEGDDQLRGGGGLDIAVFSGSIDDYVFTADGSFVVVTDQRSDGDGQDRLIDIERLRFEQDDGPDVILGVSTAGEPVIGAQTAGIVFGSDGGDIIRARGGDDTVFGADGDDSLFGGAGDDILEGGRDQDSLVGGNGDDILSGGRGDDILRGNNGFDVLSGGRGDDLLNGGRGDDDLDGGRGDDKLIGGHGDDALAGGLGDDILSGDNGDDVLAGGRGDDALKGGQGDDSLNGDRGADTLSGNGGRDMLLGGRGNDVLDGGQGHDTLSGGKDDDVLTGGSGADVLTGGSGADTFVFNAATADAIDTVMDFSAIDSLVLKGFDNPVEAVQLGDDVGLFAGNLQFALIQNATTAEISDGLF